MRIDLPLGLLLGAVVANAVLVGASLNQSIKQLPARRRIGAVLVARALLRYRPLRRRAVRRPDRA